MTKIKIVGTKGYYCDVKGLSQPSTGVRARTTSARVPSSSKCRNCGFDLRGMYGSDRQAHKDGYCRDL